MTTKKLTLILPLIGVLTASSLCASVLGEWTFNDTSSLENALGSSNVFDDAEISGLKINRSGGFGFGFAGLNHVPADEHDGYGFGGNGGAQVLFLHRANYYDGAGTDPVNDYTSFGLSPHETQGTGAADGDGNAPISFTVTAGTQPLRVDSLTLDLTSAGVLFFTFQEAGAAEGSATTVAPGTAGTAALASPVIVNAGQTKTFTVNLASYGLDSYHNVNGLQLNGADWILVHDFDAAEGSPDIRPWTPGTNGSVRLVGTLWKPSPGAAGDFRILVDGSEIWSRSFSEEDTIPHAVDISVLDLATNSVVEFIASASSGAAPVQMTAELEVLPEPYLSGWSAELPSGYPQWSPVEAQAQRDAGQVVLQQIRDASAAGDAQVVIAPGDYLFHANYSWQSTLNNLSNLEIIADGVTFWFEPPMVHGLLFNNCSDVTVRGLTIDFTIPCWSQALITGIDRQSNTVSATLMTGYEPRDQYGVAETSGEYRKMIFYNPDGGFINHQHTRGDWQLTGGGTSLTYTDISVSGIPDALEVGDYVVSPIQTGAALRSEYCARMRYEDVNIWSSPGQAVREWYGEGGHVYQRVRATRRPHTNRLQAFGADVFHLSSADLGPTLIGCESAYGGDDNINIHGRFGWIIEPGATANLYYMAGTYVAGDTIEFRDSNSVELLGTAQVLSAVPNTTTNEADFLVELDQSLSLPVGSMVVMDGWSSARDFVIRDCWFHDNYQRTLINGTPGGLIENTTLQNVGEGIRIQFETWGPWYEGPFARNLTVRNNRFLNVDPEGFTISVSMHPAGDGSDVRRFDARPFTNLTFTGNYFSQTASGAPVSIHNVDGLSIEGNIVERAPYSSPDWLTLQDCLNVVVAANQVSAPPPFANGDFSVNTAEFNTSPGYLGGGNPATIYAWTHNGTGNAGINGDGISTPFSPVDRSAATWFVFLQDAGSQISQNLSSSLEPDTTYRISYVAASRAGNAAALGRVTVADASSTFYDSGVQQWSTAAFESVSAEFTTGASFDGPVVVTLRNESPSGDLTVDYGKLEIVKVSGFTSWAEDYGLTGADAAATYDVEPDGLNNLAEYALGGNPTIADAASVLPVFQAVGSHFYFTHTERSDDSSLSYTVQLNSNLVSGIWTTNGVEFVEETGVVDDLKTVTHRTDIDSVEFMRLKIEQN